MGPPSFAPILLLIYIHGGDAYSDWPIFLAPGLTDCDAASRTQIYLPYHSHGQPHEIPPASRDFLPLMIALV
jgi:hypothetical protein